MLKNALKRPDSASHWLHICRLLLRAQHGSYRPRPGWLSPPLLLWHARTFSRTFGQAEELAWLLSNWSRWVVLWGSCVKLCKAVSLSLRVQQQCQRGMVLRAELAGVETIGIDT